MLYKPVFLSGVFSFPFAVPLCKIICIILHYLTLSKDTLLISGVVKCWGLILSFPKMYKTSKTTGEGFTFASSLLAEIFGLCHKWSVHQAWPGDDLSLAMTCPKPLLAWTSHSSWIIMYFNAFGNLKKYIFIVVVPPSAIFYFIYSLYLLCICPSKYHCTGFWRQVKVMHICRLLLVSPKGMQRYLVELRCSNDGCVFWLMHCTSMIPKHFCLEA